MAVFNIDSTTSYFGSNHCCFASVLYIFHCSAWLADSVANWSKVPDWLKQYLLGRKTAWLADTNVKNADHIITVVLIRLVPIFAISPTDPAETFKAGRHVTFYVWGRPLQLYHPSACCLSSDRRVNRCSRCLLWQVIIVGTAAKAIKPKGWQHHLVGCYFNAALIVAATVSPARPPNINNMRCLTKNNWL